MTAEHQQIEVGEVERALGLLIDPGSTFEIRALGEERGFDTTWSGYFRDAATAAKAIVGVERNARGVYFTLNPVRPSLYARRADRLVKAKKNEATGDQHIVKRSRLLIDIDAERDAGISATDAERDAALQLASEIWHDRAEAGWPEPIRADSGNGGHLVYAIDLPADDDGLIARVLAKFASLWTCELAGIPIKVDTTVANPARISKVYGTVSRKGDEVDGRDHRTSRIISAPKCLTAVTREQLEAFAGPPASAAKPQRTEQKHRSGDPLPTLDVPAWLSRHGISVKATRPNQDGGTVYELEVCPSNPDHDRGEAFVIQRGSGAITAGCHHESCRWTWAELRVQYDGTIEERRVARHTTPPGPPEWPEEPASETLDEAPDHPFTPTAERLPPQLTVIDGVSGERRERSTPAAHVPVEKPGPLILTNAEAYDELVALEEMPIIPTPLPTLNEAIGYGGLMCGCVYDIVAGPGVGKSTLAVFVAGHVAETGRALYATWEMKPGRLLARMVGGKLRRPSNNLSKTLGREHFLDAAAPGMRWIYKPTLDHLEEAIMRVADADGAPPVLVTDYVQRMAEAIMRTQLRPDARLATAEASERITDIAERAGVPVIAVAAASRNGRTKAADARKLAPGDLIDVARESSGLEFDSSGLFVLSDTGDIDEDGWKVRTLTLAKTRFGEECHIDLRFEGATGAYLDKGRVVDESKSAKAQAKEEIMREEIIASIRAAAEPLSKRSIRERSDASGKAVRWVRGREPDVRAAVDGMVNDGTLIEKIGGRYIVAPEVK